MAEINVDRLNGDISGFPEVFPITDDMKTTFSGVSRLIMLDRYSFKDTEKVTLKVGDLVVLTIKSDPTFPARGIGIITDILVDEVRVELEDQYVSQTGTEILVVPISSVDKPLELFYEQIAKRVAKGLAEVEPDAVTKLASEAAFYHELVEQNFVPAGRVLYGAGADTDVTYFNCLSGDTIVQTKEGSVPIKELNGEVEVLSMDGKYRNAEFKSYGTQELYEVVLSNGEKIKATAGHEWFYNTKSGLQKTNTLNLEGKSIPIVRKSKKLNQEEIHEGIKNGIVYGDGSIQNGEARVLLFGNKIELSRFFHGEHIMPHYKGEYVGIYKLSPELKNLPSEDKSESYWHGFIIGLIATDGYVDERGSFGFHSSTLSDLEYMTRNIHKTNFSYLSLKEVRKISPFTGGYAPNYKVQLAKQSADTSDFIRTAHAINFEKSPKSTRKASIKVITVRPLGYSEEVFCCEEPETNSFVIGTGYLTSNCYVMPYPKDSREGIGEHRNEVMEIMSRGGGVGTNGSTLRPRNALARGVNGKSSGAVSWLDDIAKLTHLVEQGGSRRGAQMIMLADWHPDIIEFIISKMQNPKILRFIIETTKDEQIRALAEQKLKFTPLSAVEREILESYAYRADHEDDDEADSAEFRHANELLEDGGRYSVHNPDFLTGANISVAITEDFMQAVENDEEYALRFPDVENYDEHEMNRYNRKWHVVGDVREWEAQGNGVKTYRTIKARELWQLINICATYAAEPGIFFIDNANEQTNAQAYGQKVVATNPCGEQPLAPYSVCNLAAVNLANMVDKDARTVDYEKLRNTVRVGVRMQDNVIDATPYFLEANRDQAIGERRVGLGVMGLADMLIYAGKVYGSAEGNELVDRVFEEIAVTAYETSIELAQEKGAFPFMANHPLGPSEVAEGFIQSGYMQEMPPHIKDGILAYGIRNSHLLTVAPTGSTGSLIGVSTGLEPYFAFKYYRSGRLGKFMEVNAAIVEELGVDSENLPPEFVTAMELSPEAHVDVQNTIQRWVDSSLSKTVNAPKGYSVEQVQAVYERLYKGGAKGGTVYVDGSRDAQVLSLSAEENDTDETADKLIPREKTVKAVENTSVTYGNEIGNTCPICREGTVKEIGGCNSCDQCGMQLKCGL